MLCDGPLLNLVEFPYCEELNKKDPGIQDVESSFLDTWVFCRVPLVDLDKLSYYLLLYI